MGRGVSDSYIRTDSNIISRSPLKTKTGKPASGGPSLANVDAIFFLGHREVELDDERKADLLSFVKDEGKGFVATIPRPRHFWDSRNLARCLEHATTVTRGAPPPARSSTRDPAFPATRHLRRRTVRLHRQFYQAKGLLTREAPRAGKCGCLERVPPNDEVHRTNHVFFPLVWAKNYRERTGVLLCARPRVLRIVTRDVGPSYSRQSSGQWG